MTDDAVRLLQVRQNWGTRMQPLRSRSEAISIEKIIRLEDEIRSSKQAVVKHVLRARALERDLTIIKTSDESLKEHLKSKFRPKTFDDLGLKIVWLEKKVITEIEASARIEGRGHNLQQAYNSYNDDELCAALEILPGNSHILESRESRLYFIGTSLQQISVLLLSVVEFMLPVVKFIICIIS